MKLIIFFSVLLFSLNSFSAVPAGVKNTKIVKVQANADGQLYIYFKGGEFTKGKNCAYPLTNGSDNHYKVSGVGSKVIHELALAAMMAGSIVEIYGGACLDSVETVGLISVSQS